MDRFRDHLPGRGHPGQVGGDMILTDPFVVRLLHPTDTVRYAVEGVLVVAVMVAGTTAGRKRNWVDHANNG